MKTDRIKAALLGLFVLTALSLLIWFVLFLRPIVGDGGKELTIYSTTLDGIVIGTRVTYAGKPVGEVTAIETLFNGKGKKESANGDLYVFKLEASVDSSVHIYDTDRITISTQGLLGEKSIAILPKAPKKDVAQQEISNRVLYIESSEGLGGIVGQLEQVGAKAEKTLDQLSHFFNENTEPTKQALVAVKDAVSNSEIPKTMKHLDEASVALREASIALTQLVQEVDQREVISKLSSTIDTIHSLTQSLERGEGSFGKFLKDETFYCQIRNVLLRLEIFLYDVNRFGILYGWDSRWKRDQRARLRLECMREMHGARAALQQLREKLPLTQPDATLVQIELENEQLHQFQQM